MWKPAIRRTGRTKEDVEGRFLIDDKNYTEKWQSLCRVWREFQS